MPLRLTQRDLSILKGVWLYRYLSTQHVARLYFKGGVKLAQRRLRSLAAEGLVDRFRSAEASRAGFRAWWYRLARQGTRVVAEAQEVSLEAILPPVRTPRSMGFLTHHALVTDFRIWLLEACSATGFGYRFMPSYEEVREGGRRQCRVALSVPGHQRLLIPDGVFSLYKGDRHALFALEADRGTEPLTGRHPSAIERKFLMYRDSYESHTAEESYASLLGAKFNGFRILCLVPDEARQQGFLELAHRVDLTPLVWVATSALVEDQGELGSMCWAVEPSGQMHRLTE